MPLGYWCPVLHAHLPYVRHPEYPDFLEEDWFFEALNETYVPLVRVMDGLLKDGVDFRLTMTLSPPLVSMMTDDLLVSRYKRSLGRLIALAEKEVDRTQREDARFTPVARFYREELASIQEVFEGRYGSNIVKAFRRFRDAGKLEIITCGATHGFFPLMETVPQAVRAQVRVAVDHYYKHFGRQPEGIWLPECGYLPGQEVHLRDAGIRYGFLESHGITDAHPQPRYGVLAPIMTPGGVAFFGRDMESSRQVWSAEIGYPGDYDYREFYRDIGWDLPLDYLGDAVPNGLRKNVGLKYYRVTGNKVALDQKQPYDPAHAREKAAAHAGNFLENRVKQVQHSAAHMDQPPIVVSPYDAELFGHWWFEGPMFLDYLFRKMHHDQHVVKAITPPEFLNMYPECDLVQPPMCTWGAKGFAEVWLNPTNDWIYPHLEMAAERMVQLARRFDHPSDLERRALNQAARELLLAQSSDWAFIMKTGTTVEYAKKRTRDHVARFTYLYEALLETRLEEPIVQDFEQRDNIFPDVDYTVYR
jgi:1,4-alpha-glucan branching enzyme